MNEMAPDVGATTDIALFLGVGMLGLGITGSAIAGVVVMVMRKR